ncbi:MAG: beta-propeller domain-containing protein [Deltaproteobacteria bacterium]|nr:beta-propeller domain-containing protein [Deltaproteobacteria bacterium]
MQTTASAALILTLLLTLLLTASCGSEDDMAPSLAQQPEATLEESDITKVEGGLLYALVGGRALRIFDVTQPRSPSLVGMTDFPGWAGELYVRDGVLVAVLDDATCANGWVTAEPLSSPSDGSDVLRESSSAVVVLDARDPQTPVQMACTPLKDKVVASRMSERHLFVVTASKVRSFALSEQLHLEPVQTSTLSGWVSQAHFTASQLFIVSEGGSTGSGGWVQPCDDGWCDYDSPEPREPVATNDSLLQVAATSPLDGSIELQGNLGLEGVVTGRFHLDAYGATFRLVTYRWDYADSLLQIIDVSDPWTPRRRGSLSLGAGEELKGTRFVDDRVYVVTFRQIDPLWVVDLSDPDAPALLSELEVPGWSDFLFPRGKTLLTVGRGDGGVGVAVSLFDVSDATQPRLLRQLTTSSWGAESEANIDHRGVTLIEGDEGTALLALPIAHVDGYCGATASSELRLLDITATDIIPRGSIEQQGNIRRSFLVKGTLLSVSDTELVAVDIQDPDYPEVTARVDTEATGYDATTCMDDDANGMVVPFGCEVGGSPAGAWPLGLFLLALWFGRQRLAVR